MVGGEEAHTDERGHHEQRFHRRNLCIRDHRSKRGSRRIDEGWVIGGERRNGFGGPAVFQRVAAPVSASETELPASADPKSRTTLRRTTGWLYTVATASRTGERTAARRA